MIRYASEFELPTRTKGIKEPKEKVDCKTCGNARECAGCKLKESKMTNAMKNISLTLFQSCSNRWIPRNKKISYLNELSQMINELQNEI